MSHTVTARRVANAQRVANARGAANARDVAKAPGVATLALSVVILAGCGAAQVEEARRAEVEAVAAVTANNTLTEAEREAGWELLFDGRSLDGWRPYDRDGAPEGWSAEDGLLVRSGPGGDIMTDREFTDFELTLEWRLEEGGNSGVFYRAAMGEEWIYHSAPEMQILDDERHPDGQSLLTSAGANYGLHPAPRGVVRAVGEWNEVRVIVNGAHVEHWLNGSQIVEYELGSPDWEERVANSKFTQWPAYGRAPVGHIGLQDHGDPVWYRNVKIRVIR